VLIFSWDPVKAASNIVDHDGVSFEEAASIFASPLTLEIDDPDHSDSEERFLALGESERGRLLVVSFAESIRDHIRIISARRATSHERRNYEQGE
jgi:uncharacterized DUF497 family protein